jgi:hypothetical protein
MNERPATASEGRPPPEQPTATPTVSREDQVSALARYLVSNRGTFTEEALAASARSSGYAEDVVADAIDRARADATSPPTTQRARRWILAAYLATFAVLTTGMFVSESARRYGGHIVATFILAAALGFALLISLLWLRSQGRAVDGAPAGMVTVLAVPIVLLVVVAGLCIGTGLPIPRPY